MSWTYINQLETNAVCPFFNLFRVEITFHWFNLPLR
jgi:hypothetical protein